MNRAWLALFGLMLSTGAYGQAQLGPGQVLGNSSASEAPARSSTITSMFDRALGSTPGTMILRGSSTWGAAAISGDCTVSNIGAIVCTKTNGLSLGTMATQNANAVAITGGSVTGLPTPVNPSDAARLQDVSAAAAGIIFIPATALATAAILPNTPIYNNGASGVGATLTAGSNSTLTVDGTVASLGAVVLVQNQASGFQNGVYTVTTAGGGVPWVLTRATYFNAPSNMLAGSNTLVTGGATHAGQSFALQSTTTTVGTTSVNFNLSFATGVNSIAGLTGAFTLGNGLTNSGNAVLVDASVIGDYLSGLTLSTAGSSATFGISKGVAADGTNATLMKLASAYTKTTGTWALGTAAGSLDTGAIAASTWYHVYLIQRPDTGVVDVLISLSASAPTLPTNYTLFRRIGSMKTNGSSQWTLFHQTGDEFLWDLPVGDVSSVATSTGGIIVALTVPPGVAVTAMFNATMTSNTVGILALFQSPNQANQVAATPSGNFHLYIQVANQYPAGQFAIRTNTASQIRMVSNAAVATCTISIATQGYIDRRGKDL